MTGTVGRKRNKLGIYFAMLSNLRLIRDEVAPRPPLAALKTVSVPRVRTTFDVMSSLTSP